MIDEAAAKDPVTASQLPPGGGFLLAEVGAAPIDTPDLFTSDQREFFRTARKFGMERVVPAADAIEAKDFPTVRRLFREAGELGLLSLDVPEEHGGLAQGMTTSALVAEAMTVLGSWSVMFGAQVGIGTLPIVYFGTPEQQAKYLPRLVSGEWVAAYALSEPSSGSDAMAAKTRAVLSPDGKHWILNGTKQWISNAGFADVFIVFAKVDGEKFSAFIVDKDTPGFTTGSEEHKMGIRGSSTRSLIFEDARVPVANLLGEIGKGHRIAFNILNIGRLKLGVTCMAGVRHVIEISATYAKDRKAFGRPISDFGLIREKLARMVALAYVGEAMSYRTTGLIDRRADGRRGHPRHEGVRARPHRSRGGVQRRGLDPQGMGLGGARLGGRRGGPDSRWVWVRGGVPHRADLPGQPGEPDLRGHERDQPADRPRHAAQAGRQGRLPVPRAGEEGDPGGRDRRGAGARQRPAGARAARGRAEQADLRVRRRRGRDGLRPCGGRAAGGSGGARRRGHGGLRGGQRGRAHPCRPRRTRWPRPA